MKKIIVLAFLAAASHADFYAGIALGMEGMGKIEKDAPPFGLIPLNKNKRNAFAPGLYVGLESSPSSKIYCATEVYLRLNNRNILNYDVTNLLENPEIFFEGDLLAKTRQAISDMSAAEKAAAQTALEAIPKIKMKRNISVSACGKLGVTLGTFTPFILVGLAHNPIVATSSDATENKKKSNTSTIHFQYGAGFKYTLGHGLSLGLTFTQTRGSIRFPDKGEKFSKYCENRGAVTLSYAFSQ